MKYVLSSVLLVCLFASCANNDEPAPSVFMLPSAITTADANGSDQRFHYDKYGRIEKWTIKYSDNTSVVANYSYPDENTIIVDSEEELLSSVRIFSETISLVNGRAVQSAGTFIYKQSENSSEYHKTYRLEYDYDPANNLAVVKHSEIQGIGDEIPDLPWNKPWEWENYLIWEDGNLIRFEDFQGKSEVFRTTEYEYSDLESDYTIIVPNVINSYHHFPLQMQGVFGSNSKNLLSSMAITDNDGRLVQLSDYSYELKSGLVESYTATTTPGSAFSTPIKYTVSWTDR